MGPAPGRHTCCRLVAAQEKIRTLRGKDRLYLAQLRKKHAKLSKLGNAHKVRRPGRSRCGLFACVLITSFLMSTLCDRCTCRT